MFLYVFIMFLYIFTMFLIINEMIIIDNDCRYWMQWNRLMDMEWSVLPWRLFWCTWPDDPCVAIRCAGATWGRTGPESMIFLVHRFSVWPQPSHSSSSNSLLDKSDPDLFISFIFSFIDWLFRSVFYSFGLWVG